MANVLLIYDDQSAQLTAAGVLETLSLSSIRLVPEEFDGDFPLTEMFDLIIFELSGANRSCVTILKQLEKQATTSGIDHPPIIVIMKQGLEITEQALRTAKVSFFFVKPLAEAELAAAILQSLQPPTTP